MMRTLRSTGTIIWVTIGAAALSGAYTLAGGPNYIANLIVGAEMPTMFVLLTMMLILLFTVLVVTVATNLLAGLVPIPGGIGVAAGRLRGKVCLRPDRGNRLDADRPEERLGLMRGRRLPAFLVPAERDVDARLPRKQEDVADQNIAD